MPGVRSLTAQILASADDAQQGMLGNPSVTDVNVQVIAWTWAIVRTIGGLRFALDMPRNATILSAALSLYITGVPNDADAAAADIKLEQADDPGDFDGDDLLSRWPVGGPSVAWVDSGLGEGWTTLPDIGALLQAIVDRPGWNAGQSVVVLMLGRDDVRRVLYFTSWDGVPALAATLAITYSAPSIQLVGSHTPLVTLVGSQDEEVALPASGSDTISLIGSHTATIGLVGSHTTQIALEGSFDE